MSTAFRYCGLEGGACGFEVYAPQPPGDSGKTLAYYDACAQASKGRQLGNLMQLQLKRRKRLQSFVQMWPKNESDAEIAAHESFAASHLHNLSSRGARLRHSPPIFHCGHGPPFFEEIICGL